MLYRLHSGLGEKTNDVIKIQLGKFPETLTKVLSLVLLHLRSLPFEKPKLTPDETVSGRPMHLLQSPYCDPQIAQQDLLKNC